MAIIYRGISVCKSQLRFNRICFFAFFLIFQSTQTNAQWSLTSGPEGGEITAFASDGTNLFATVYLAGIFHSSNNGNSWTSISNGLSSLLTNDVLLSGTNLYVATNFGISFSGNFGRHGHRLIMD